MRIIANSLPKSGTHVLTRVLELLGYYENHIHLSAALTDTYSNNPIRNLQSYLNQGVIRANSQQRINVDLDNPERKITLAALKRILDTFPRNSYCQGHVPFTDSLHSVLLNDNFKVLYIIRDPRDVLISFINQQLKDNQYPFHILFNSINATERIRIVLQGYTFKNGRRLASLEERYTSSIPWYHAAQVLSVRFEDLIGNQGGGDKYAQVQNIKNIINYLGVKIMDQEISKITEQIYHPGAETFFKGKVGGWKEGLSSQNIKYINDTLSASQLSEYMNLLGYSW